MSITVGTDTYISVTDADTYFSKRYNGESWANFTTGDKERLLTTATHKIDRLNLKGRKKIYTQTLAFPRVYRITDCSIYDLNGYQVDAVPDNVKYAACEEAFAMADTELTKRKELQNQGVTSFSLGSLSESYQGRSSNPLLSKEATEYLKGWLLGAVRI